MTEPCTTVSNTPRTKGGPFKKRVGDDLLTRSPSGEVRRSFGDYSATAIRARKEYAGRRAFAFSHDPTLRKYFR